MGGEKRELEIEDESNWWVQYRHVKAFIVCTNIDILILTYIYLFILQCNWDTCLVYC